MNMIQRILSLLLTATLLVGMVGCGISPAQTVHSHGAESASSLYANLSNPGGTDQSFDLTQPFDQSHPDLVQAGAVDYDKTTLLLKLPESGASVTEAMAQAGVSGLELLFSVEDGVWYEAALAEGTDIHAAATALRAMEEILLVDYNYRRTSAAMADKQEIPNNLLQNQKANDQWYLRYCDIPSGMKLLDQPGGSPDVIVAVIDTGVDYTHDDLKDNIWINEDEIPDNGMDDDGNGYIDDYYGVNIINGWGSGSDDNGHGTHVAGIIAASDNKIGVVGIAYNVKIMPIKAGGNAGVFNDSDLARAVVYATMHGADVINMSFGGGGVSIAVQEALERAHGTSVLVASAGNDGAPNEDIPALPASPSYPAAFSFVIGVMSVDNQGVESEFTNFDVNAYNNVEYELYAPGEDMLSTIPGNRYASWDGTSMAAPVVSAIAALLRSQYPDKEAYPSKFICGQLTATSSNQAACFDPSLHITAEGDSHNLPTIVNLAAALTKLPKPEVNLADWALFDTEGLPHDAGLNNGDGVVDAGETIALGVTLRNRWGKSKDTVVTIDTLSPAGMPDPYVTIVNPSANYGAVGTYSEADSGRIYTDDLLTGWENPFYIKIAENCPNDYHIRLNVTVTCGNGLDTKDNQTYTTTGTITFAVRSGTLLPQAITEDMTLTGDKIYIISDTTVIENGATVTVEAGARIQFWTADPEDPYAQKGIAQLLVRGELWIEGTAEKPVYIYPSDLMWNYSVEISGNVYMRYADVTNLISYARTANETDVIREAEHCTFRFNTPHLNSRGYTTSGGTTELTLYETKQPVFLHAKDCVFENIKTSSIYRPTEYYACWWSGLYERCAFVDCSIIGRNSFFAKDCLFQGCDQSITIESFPSQPIYYDNTAAYVYWPEDDRTYLEFLSSDGNSMDVEIWVHSLGGSPMVIDSQKELDWLENESGAFFQYWPENCDFIGYQAFHMIEVPGHWTVAELVEDYYAFYEEIGSQIHGSVILNKTSTVLDSAQWLHFRSGEAPGTTLDISGNYWGTTNTDSIDLQIVDYRDDPINLGTLDYQPLLTTPPENTFPFVTGVTLYNKDGQAVTTVGNEEITVQITFNRDMDTSLPLTVAYGSAEPYNDQIVSGDWVNARTWEGKKTIPTTVEGGEQYFTIYGGRSDSDDLKLCTDTYRFRFTIQSIGAQAMTLQSEANHAGVYLTWEQDDFDTLMGYNVYRSDSENGYYARLNDLVIPSDVKEYQDTAAAENMTYYYHFTVVRTDMSESKPSNTSSVKTHQFGVKVSQEPTCTEPGWATFTCINCGAQFEGDMEPLGHEYTYQMLFQSCTEPGGTLWTCFHCGDSYTENYQEPLGHNFCEWYLGCEATCTSEGEEVRYCDRCWTHEYRVIPITDHRYNENTIDPTCDEQGYTQYLCDHCGYSYNDHFVDALGHDFEEWYVTSNATEDSEGEERRECYRCRISESRVIPKLDHSHNYDAVVTNPTCTEDGYTTYTCRCGDTYTADETAALGHNFGKWTVVKEPTEDAEGEERRECARCDESETRSIPKLDHVHDYKSTVTDPTCTEDGYTTHTCRCGDTYTADETSALGHDFGKWTVVKEPTEDAEGEERRECARCDESETRSIPKLDHVHDYKSTVTAPTCTEEGYTTYTCKCGDTYTGDEVPALGHDYGDWITLTPPTCSEEGRKIRICSRCNMSDPQSIPVAEHTFRNGSCINCGAEDPDYVEPVENPFTDVPAGQWYTDPVLWAVEQKITSGTSANAFSPDKTCTRGQVVTFLWRAKGEPEPTLTENPFSDVKASDYFYKAVLWAVENGITSGTSKTTFSPNNPCTRAQVVTFLWRTMEKPTPEQSEIPFTDVPAGQWYTDPVLWAVENGITSGTSKTTFAPNNPCTRAQVVTFLYRTLKDK